MQPSTMTGKELERWVSGQAGTQTGVTHLREDRQPEKLILKLKCGLICRKTGKQRDKQRGG